MSRKRKLVNNRAVLRHQIQQELKEGNNCVDIFMRICSEQKYRRIEQEDVSQCFQQFEESPKFRNTMDEEQYMLFCMILSEYQLKRNGLGLWKSLHQKHILHQEGFFILSSRLVVAPILKNRRIMELLFFDMFYGEHISIPYNSTLRGTKDNLPGFQLIGLNFLMMYKKHKNFVHIHLVKFDLSERFCECTDSLSFKKSNFTLLVESINRRQFVICERDRAEVFEIRSIENDKFKFDIQTYSIKTPSLIKYASYVEDKIYAFAYNQALDVVLIEHNLDSSKELMISETVFTFKDDENAKMITSSNNFNCTLSKQACFIFVKDEGRRHQLLCLNLSTRTLNKIVYYLFERLLSMYFDEDNVLTFYTTDYNKKELQAHRITFGKPDTLVNLTFFSIKRHFTFNKENELYTKLLPQLPSNLQSFCLNVPIIE